MTDPATMNGWCMLTQPAGEIGRVYPVNAKTQSCPTSCRETLEVEAAAAKSVAAQPQPSRLATTYHPPPA